MIMLINKKYVRERALLAAKNMRAHRYTRVAESFYEEANRALDKWITEKIRQQPSKGETIR